MKYLYILTLLIVSVSFTAKAQYAMFAKEGTVHYDKTMYVKNIIKKQFAEKVDEGARNQFEAMIPRLPESVVLKKSLRFKGVETLFLPEKQEVDPMTKQMLMMLDYDATTYSNLATKNYQRYNDIFGQKVIIEDTVKKIDWRITDEYREIAGFSCRRANGITKDSIYVVAYYAVEIPIDGGPESINGLPGLILGLAVPSQHLSYFATKVEFATNTVIDKKLFENTKVKRMNRTDIAKMFKDSFGNFFNSNTIDYVVKLALM